MLEQDKEIRGKWNYVFWTNFYIGLAKLFSWSITISVTSYWNYKLREINGSSVAFNNTEQITDLQKIYNSYLSIAANVPNAVLLIATAVFGHRFSTKWQVFGSQVFIAFGLRSMAIFALFDTDSYQKVFLHVNSVLFAIVCGVQGP